MRPPPPPRVVCDVWGGAARALLSWQDEEGSPLSQKLDVLVELIGKAGILAALTCFFAMSAIGFGIQGERRPLPGASHRGSAQG